MTDNTQLTSASGYDTKNMIFSEAQMKSDLAIELKRLKDIEF